MMRSIWIREHLCSLDLQVVRYECPGLIVTPEALEDVDKTVEMTDRTMEETIKDVDSLEKSEDGTENLAEVKQQTRRRPSTSARDRNSEIEL
ncbi:MAG: hypothetical protein CMB97_01785 [Flavobacteriaceae bacterium]|nr:hypothetical protein [Flavobacteriaceae bacterium]